MQEGSPDSLAAAEPAGSSSSPSREFVQPPPPALRRRGSLHGMTRTRVLVGRRVLALVLLGSALLCGEGAGAREDVVEEAKRALVRGDFGKAEELLGDLEVGEPVEVEFLRGSVALAREDWITAIERFRAVLARDPDLPRVRLDLAYAMFRAGHDVGAALHFRQALGDEEMPEAARVRALRFLEEIRRRKSWSARISVALAPDTNINASTRARQVDLFGLPARVSEDAREKAGMGLSVVASAEREADMTDDVRVGMSVDVRTRSYRDRRFNDRVLSLRAGPRVLAGQALEVRPETILEFRRLGGKKYSSSTGLGLSASWMAMPAWSVDGAAEAARISYEGVLGRGTAYGLRTQVSHAAGRAVRMDLHAVARREAVDLAKWSWREWGAGISMTVELPRGFVIGVGPTWRWRVYGAADPAFGEKARRDRSWAGHVGVSNRHVDVFGFMPRATLRHERRRSTVGLFDYTRTVVELGLVRSF